MSLHQQRHINLALRSHIEVRYLAQVHPKLTPPNMRGKFNLGSPRAKAFTLP